MYSKISFTPVGAFVTADVKNSLGPVSGGGPSVRRPPGRRVAVEVDVAEDWLSEYVVNGAESVVVVECECEGECVEFVEVRPFANREGVIVIPLPELKLLAMPFVLLWFSPGVEGSPSASLSLSGNPSLPIIGDGGSDPA
jgi:hypothetical protein